MNGRKMAVVAAMLLVFTASARLTGAYLTDVPEKLENSITPGSVDVDLTETKWNPEAARQLLPGSTVQKNPAAKNTGKNEAWIFLKVQIPVKELCTVDPVTKKKEEKAEKELFAFAAKDAWELLGKEREEAGVIYLYGYHSVVQPQEMTETLFEEVTLVNYLEGELDETDSLSIPVEAMAIQTNVCAADATLQDIYEQYLLQKKAA